MCQVLARGKDGQVLNIAPAPVPVRVTLDFWADLACPWSYIGSRRLALAVAHEPDGSVVTRWRALPTVRAHSADHADSGIPPLTDDERAEIIHVGRDVGIAFRPDALERPVDTELALRAVLLYDGHARQRCIVAGLFAAHFERGRDISRHDTVVEVAAHCSGEEPQRVSQRLLAGEGREELDADRQEARRRGIRVVPTYVAAGEVSVEGVREVEALRQLIAEGRRVGG